MTGSVFLVMKEAKMVPVTTGMIISVIRGIWFRDKGEDGSLDKGEDGSRVRWKMVPMIT